jgi:hypothetical protein
VLLLLLCRLAGILKHGCELIFIKPTYQAGKSSTNGSQQVHFQLQFSPPADMVIRSRIHHEKDTSALQMQASTRK